MLNFGAEKMRRSEGDEDAKFWRRKMWYSKDVHGITQIFGVEKMWHSEDVEDAEF